MLKDAAVSYISIETCRPLPELAPHGLTSFKGPLRKPSEKVEYSGEADPREAKKFEAVTPYMEEALKYLVNGSGPKFLFIEVPTGGGKSTNFPVWLLRSELGKWGKIWVTEPRLSVIKPKEVCGPNVIPHYLGTKLIGAPGLQLEDGRLAYYGRGQLIGVKYSFTDEEIKKMFPDLMFDEVANRLIFCSDGILIRKLVSEDIYSISTIVIDEAHEMSSNMCALYSIIKELVAIYPHLRIVFASATVNVEWWRDFYKPYALKVIAPKDAGTQFDVHVNWPGREPTDRNPDEPALKIYKQHFNYAASIHGFEEVVSGRGIASQASLIVKGIREGNLGRLEDPYGDIVIFCPSERTVNATCKAVMALNLPNLMVFPLHRKSAENIHAYLQDSQIDKWAPTDKQGKEGVKKGRTRQIKELAAFEISESMIEERLASIAGELKQRNGSEASSLELFQELARRKRFQRVIIGTNYIETGITMTATYVIETAFQFQTAFDARLGTSPGKEIRAAQDKVRQRWGRVGRKTDGEVFCTYDYGTFMAFEPYTKPENTREALDGSLLKIMRVGVSSLSAVKLFGIDLNEESVKREYSRAVRQLISTGAVDIFGNLTDDGLVMENQQEPMVNAARITLWGERFSCTAELCTVVACLKVTNQEQEGGSLMEQSPRGFWGFEAIRRTCRDDLEFYLKAFTIWMNARERGREEEVVAEYGFNREVCQRIENERKGLAETFEKNAHISDTRRQLDIGRIDRMRGAFVRTLRDSVFRLGEDGILIPVSKKRVSTLLPVHLDRKSAVFTAANVVGTHYVVYSRKMIGRIGQESGLSGSDLIRVDAALLPFLEDNNEARLIMTLATGAPSGQKLLEATRNSMLTEPLKAINLKEVFLVGRRYEFVAETKATFPNSVAQGGNHIRNYTSWYLLRTPSSGGWLLACLDSNLVQEGETFSAEVEAIDPENKFLVLTQEPIREELRSKQQEFANLRVEKLLRDNKNDEIYMVIFASIEPGIVPVIQRYQFSPFEQLIDAIRVGDSITVKVTRKKGKLYVFPAFALNDLSEKDFVVGYCGRTAYSPQSETDLCYAGLFLTPGGIGDYCTKYVYEGALPTERIDQFVRGRFYRIPAWWLRQLKGKRAGYAPLGLPKQELQNTETRSVDLVWSGQLSRVPMAMACGLKRVRTYQIKGKSNQRQDDSFTYSFEGYPVTTRHPETMLRKDTTDVSEFGDQYRFKSASFEILGILELTVLEKQPGESGINHENQTVGKHQPSEKVYITVEQLNEPRGVLSVEVVE